MKWESTICPARGIFSVFCVRSFVGGRWKAHQGCVSLLSSVPAAPTTVVGRFCFFLSCRNLLERSVGRCRRRRCDRTQADMRSVFVVLAQPKSMLLVVVCWWSIGVELLLCTATIFATASLRLFSLVYTDVDTPTPVVFNHHNHTCTT